VVVYVGAADICAQLKSRLRPALADGLDETDVEALARHINGSGFLPSHIRLELEAERYNEALGTVMPIFEDAIRMVTAMLDQSRANLNTGRENRLARICRLLLEHRLEQLKAAREVTRTMWAYGPSFLSAAPVQVAHLIHAGGIADETLAVVQTLQRRAGKKPQLGYGSAGGPVITFTHDALRLWLPQLWLPLLLPDVEFLGPDRLRNLLVQLRKARDRAGG
jgi:hypothetical protein